MGKDEYFRSFRENADNFICSLLPGISGHPQIQYSPGRSTVNQLTTVSCNHGRACAQRVDFHLLCLLQAASSSWWATATCST